MSPHVCGHCGSPDVRWRVMTSDGRSSLECDVCHGVAVRLVADALRRKLPLMAEYTWAAITAEDTEERT